MKIQFSLFLILIVFSSGNTQSLADASYWFEKYEYSKSAELYNACNQIKPLSRENMKRVAYSYYTIGNYSKSKEYLDSITKWEDIDPFFHYMHGEVNYALMNFNQAKQSYLKINPIPEDLEKEYHISLKIAACNLIKKKPTEDYLKFEELSSNTSKADINGPLIKSNKIIYQEKGKDSIGNVVSESQLDSAELFLLRPHFYNDDGELTPIEFIDSVFDFNLENISVNSIAFSPLNKMVYVSFSNPLKNKAFDKLSRIYEGVFNENSSKITLLKPWKFSGFEDSSSCAHISISENGRFFLFSKIGDSTDGSDIFMSVFSETDANNWTNPVSLDVINSPFNDMYPMFCGDSLITFSCNNPFGYGGLDIYKSKFNQGNLEKPVHLNYPFNSFKDDFNYNYLSIDSVLLSSNRNGTGDDDVYLFVYPQNNIGDSVFALKNKMTLDSIQDIINEIDSKTDFVKKWSNKNVYFDFDSHKLDESKLEFIDLIEYIKRNPKSKVLLEGHTDSRGPDYYNYNLGLRRANSVKSYLMRQTILENQIQIVSKGEKNPPVSCLKKCSKNDHAKNRVVFIRLIP